jgi:hypothetical protein
VATITCAPFCLRNIPPIDRVLDGSSVHGAAQRLTDHVAENTRALLTPHLALPKLMFFGASSTSIAYFLQFGARSKPAWDLHAKQLSSTSLRADEAAIWAATVLTFGFNATASPRRAIAHYWTGCLTADAMLQSTVSRGASCGVGQTSRRVRHKQFFAAFLYHFARFPSRGLQHVEPLSMTGSSFKCICFIMTIRVLPVGFKADRQICNHVCNRTDP